MRSVSVRVVSNRIPALIEQIVVKSRESVDNVAQQIQQRAEATAPRDTGSLAVSIYRTNGTQSDYNQRTGQARNVNDGVIILDEIRPEHVISPSGGADATYVSVVGVAASHGIFQELGTVFQRPQPFMRPAILGAEDELVTQLSRVAD